MKINKLLIRDDSVIEYENRLFLIIVFLHFNGLINREKLKSLFIALKNGKLRRLVKNYNCKINNKWYNDEIVSEILFDVYNDSSVTKSEIDIKEFIEYVQLYLGKKYSYCIDHIFNEFVKLYINKYADSKTYYHHYLKNILSFRIVNERNINTTEFDNFKTYGYCCSDCDGEYDSYKENSYIYDVIYKNTEIIEKEVNLYFNLLYKKVIFK